MVSIVAFQAMDPGSIPGRRTLFESKKQNGQAFWVFCTTYQEGIENSYQKIAKLTFALSN